MDKWCAATIKNQLTGEKYVHIYPMDDLREHTTTDCWCEPEMKIQHKMLIYSHNSLDRREDAKTIQ